MLLPSFLNLSGNSKSFFSDVSLGLCLKHKTYSKTALFFPMSYFTYTYDQWRAEVWWCPGLLLDYIPPTKF